MTSRKKPGLAFWATAVFSLLVLYVLSFGPAVSLCYRTHAGNYAIGIIYRPIFILATRHRESDKLLRRYVHLCGLSEAIEPSASESGVIVWCLVDPKWQHHLSPTYVPKPDLLSRSKYRPT